MNTNLKELKEKESALVRKLNLLQARVERIENEEELPKLKGKYLNKYFKYRNCYSCPQTEKDYWWMYIKATAVSLPFWVEATTLQKDSHGIIRIEPEAQLTLSSCTIEITKKEFDQESLKICNKITRLLTSLVD